MQLAIHREEELGGPLGHLTDLGVPKNNLNFSGKADERVKNVILKAASKTKTKTGDECYDMCLADSRCAHLLLPPLHTFSPQTRRVMSCFRLARLLCFEAECLSRPECIYCL